MDLPFQVSPLPLPPRHLPLGVCCRLGPTPVRCARGLEGGPAMSGIPGHCCHLAPGRKSPAPLLPLDARARPPDPPASFPVSRPPQQGQGLAVSISAAATPVGPAVRQRNRSGPLGRGSVPLAIRTPSSSQKDAPRPDPTCLQTFSETHTARAPAGRAAAAQTSFIRIRRDKAHRLPLPWARSLTPDLQKK